MCTMERLKAKQSLAILPVFVDKIASDGYKGLLKRGCPTVEGNRELLQLVEGLGGLFPGPL